MPRKRKALADASSNTSNSQPNTRNAKTARTSKKSTAPVSAANINPPAIKYCNANTLSGEPPKLLNLQWPNIGDFVNDKDQDMPAEGQVIDEFCYRTSDLGFPVSEDGIKICMYLDEEMDKRNQDKRNMYICNDWNGWGMREVWENLIKDFNSDIFKKTISPYKKYAYIEGGAAFVKSADLCEFINNEDAKSVAAVAQFLGVMILTTYDMLKEHNLLVPSTSKSKFKNLETVALIWIEFVLVWGAGLDCQWACEVVRCFDEAGIDLEKSLRKQIAVPKEQITKFRDEYRKKKEESEHATDGHDGNGYATFANMPNWKPKDDKDEDGMKMFYRWDWEIEYKAFKKNYSGGKRHDLTKMSKAERRRYEF